MRGTNPGRFLRLAMAMGLALLACALAAPTTATAAPHAAFVMDARTGEVLFEENADRRLHPASLTKMMTLYLAIEAVKEGRLSLDQKVKISARAARQPPSRIGLKTGQYVTVRNLIRATAVKSANDAATALAEATAGSIPAWSRMANAKAQMLGMTNTTLKNPHGLTQAGHLSTARDMATLGRRLFFDHPEYYNIFSRKKTTAMGRTVYATNRRLLSDYAGADGIKTGYTRAAGFNLVGSAHRGEKRVIAAVFGARSSADRTRQMAKLLDLGFRRSPAHADVIPPSAPTAGVLLVEAPVPDTRPAPPKTLLARVGAVIAPSAANASELVAPGPVTAQAPRRAEFPVARPALEIGSAMQLPPRRP